MQISKFYKFVPMYFLHGITNAPHFPTSEFIQVSKDERQFDVTSCRTGVSYTT